MAIQDLYLSGNKVGAIQRVPDALVDAVTIVGPPGRIAERLATCRRAGVTTLVATVHGADQASRLRTIEIMAAAA